MRSKCRFGVSSIFQYDGSVTITIDVLEGLGLAEPKMAVIGEGWNSAPEAEMGVVGTEGSCSFVLLIH